MPEKYVLSLGVIAMKPVESQIHSKLTARFRPIHLDVANESAMLIVPPSFESHFMVVLVTSDLEDMRQVHRYQAIYATLAEELSTGVHALALHTYSPAEWQSTQSVPASPQCLGGGKHNA